MKKLLIGLISGTSLFLLAACGDSGTQPTEPPKTGSLEPSVPSVAASGSMVLPTVG